MSMCLICKCICSSVEPTVHIVTSVEPTYKAQLTLSCDVSVPQKLYKYVIPYTSILWSTPHHEMNTPEDDQMQREISENGTGLRSSLTIFSVNESHNGMYICQAIIHIPQSDQVISGEAVYDLRVNGE